MLPVDSDGVLRLSQEVNGDRERDFVLIFRVVDVVAGASHARMHTQGECIHRRRMRERDNTCSDVERQATISRRTSDDE